MSRIGKTGQFWKFRGDATPALGPSSVSRQRAFTSLLLIVPCLAFVVIGFVLPMGLMLMRSVENREVSRVFPQTTSLLRDWKGEALPPESAFAVLAQEIDRAYAQKTLGPAGRRLNLEVSGYLELLMSTGRSLNAEPALGANMKERLIAADRRWGEAAFWLAIKRNSAVWTDFYFLSAMDMQRTDAGIEPVQDHYKLYLEVIVRTLTISLSVTGLCLLVAYPLAHTIAVTTPAVANILLMLVLLPFWTSILVRSTAWIILLQREGIVNSGLIWLGIINSPFELIFTRFSVLLALTHVLLPYMVLALYSVMKGIDPRYMRAAASLGANPWQAFRSVYLPQTYAGMAAGCLLVFILSVGSYVTPALVGGRREQMIAQSIAFNMNQTVNWGLASALSVLLLTIVLVLYGFYGRVSATSTPEGR